MAYFYMLHFTSDSGHVAQFALHIPTGKIYSRTSYKGGAFIPWRRLDVSRFGDGMLDETVRTSTNAHHADMAGRLGVPISIAFTGDVSGELSFDGSQNVTCTMRSPKIINMITALENRLDAIEGRMSSDSV